MRRAQSDRAVVAATLRERQISIKLLLTDMMMPVMDGATLITAVRLQSPTVSIVAMTGLPAQSATGAYSTLDVNAVLAKPFTAETLLSTLQRALGSQISRIADGHH